MLLLFIELRYQLPAVCACLLISVLIVMLMGSYRVSFPIFPKFTGLTKDHSSCICTGHNLPKFTELMAFVNFSNFFGSKKVKKMGCDFADEGTRATTAGADRAETRSRTASRVTQAV